MTPDGHLDPRPVLTSPAGPTPSRVIEERDLVAAVLRKDRKATAQFVSRYADPVYAYVRQRLAPRNDLVDDVVQDVFLAALKGLGAFAEESLLGAWLLGIARHKVEDYYRAQLRNHESFSELDDESTSIPVAFPRFDERIDHSRLKNETRRILAQLPEPYRLALLWRYWEGRSAKEMAAQTGRTEKAVERLLARARVQFKELWEAE